MRAGSGYNASRNSFDPKILWLLREFAGGTLDDLLWDVVVVGAGVLGTFHAYFACQRGLRTLLIERDTLPGQASVRNFGLVIPSAMPPGDWHRRGLESAAVYRQLAEDLPIPLSRGGTQYLATTPTEGAVLEEFFRAGPSAGYRCQFLDARQSVTLNPAIAPKRCLASLHFPDDVRIEPRALFRVLIPWMVRHLGCVYLPGTVVVRVVNVGKECRVTTAARREYRARHVFVCSGSDLRTLFPEHFQRAALVHCKLQMLRTEAQESLVLPTALASGLSLRKYPSFQMCPSWSRLQDEEVDPEVTRRGIHVFVVQDPDGSLVIGDSHEYAAADPDEKLESRTEQLILAEAGRLVRLPHWRVAERWLGVYTLHPERPLFSETVDDRIHLLTGIGGKGMTTGAALARESIGQIE
jgi:FAD dependent oxidoreductase TIGR03364